jgi:CHASE3 domain sensor protein
MQDRTTKRILAFFLLISAILVVVAVQAARNIKQSNDSSDWVNHTHATILEIEALRTALYVAEASSRSYLWSNSVNDLTTCNKALSDIGDHLSITQALTRYDSTKAQEVSEIESLIEQHTSGLRDILTTKQEEKTHSDPR